MPLRAQRSLVDPVPDMVGASEGATNVVYDRRRVAVHAALAAPGPVMLRSAESVGAAPPTIEESLRERTLRPPKSVPGAVSSSVSYTTMLRMKLGDPMRIEST